MSTASALLLLFLAALLEASGDALVRSGLHAPSASLRGAMFLAGALVLFAYGYAVNAPAWDFGRLLGIYVVFFFLVAQAISWLVFSQPPAASVLIGGAFIVVGGIVIAAGPLVAARY
jgi:small multidrug resistance family-3 protein